VPPKLDALPPGRGRQRNGAPPLDVGDYLDIKIQGQPYLKCRLCQEAIPLQSSLAIAEELLRISAYLEPETPTYPNDQCPSYGQPASDTL